MVLREGIARLFMLNSTARSFWERFTTGIQPDQIAAEWQLEYGLDKGRASAEVEKLIASFTQAGMLGPPDSGAPRVSSGLSPARFECGPTAPQPRHCHNVARTFSVQCSSRELEQRVRWIYTHLEAPDESSQAQLEIVEHPNGYSINLDGLELAALDSFEQLLPAILFHVGELGRQDRSQVLVLHAGAVARGGRCLLFPANSGSGKSTLVAYLCHNGFDYLSDDMTPIDAASLQAEPAPTCLSIKSGSWNVVARFRPDLMERQPIPGIRPMRLLTPPPTESAIWRRRYPVSGIVCPRFDPSKRTALQSLNPFELLQEIVDSQAYFQQPLLPDRVARLVQWVAEVPGYRMDYASLEEAARQIESLI